MSWKVTIERIRKVKKLFDNDFCPLFICGVAGSGTTLLGRLLDQRYENAGYINESHLSAPTGSVLKMKKIACYETLSNYYKAMFISDDISDKQIRASLIRHYRRVTVYPKLSNVIIDKAPNLHLVRAKRLRTTWVQSKFLLIYRDPVSSVEGLRRKWPLFAEANLVQVCDFWDAVYKIFLEESRAFATDVISLSYEHLTQQTDNVLDQLAQFAGLQPRRVTKLYSDRPNVSGRGLRNVVGGLVDVAPLTDSPSTSVLSLQECDYVRQRLAPVYNQLQAHTKTQSAEIYL